MRNTLLLAFALGVSALACGGPSPKAPPVRSTPPGTSEQRADRYLEAVREDPLLLAAFLSQMPKGADLHNHLAGAVYAEGLIELAAKDNLCVDRRTMTFGPPPCSEPERVAVRQALTDAELFRQLVDAFSMREFQAGQETPKEHFFGAFAKFRAATKGHSGEMLAEVLQRAAHQNESYLEVSVNLEPRAAALVQKPWEEACRERECMARAKEAIDKAQIKEAVNADLKELDDIERGARAVLGCASQAVASADSVASGPCGVGVRYVFEVHRAAPPEHVFAELLAGFEAAKADPRIVAVSLDGPEDSRNAMKDYRLHMHMIDFMKSSYPSVHVTLEAGELHPGLVPPGGMRSHVREAIELGHAERVGHAVDVAYEDRPIELLKELAQKKVAIEVCLTSNEIVLGITGSEHPLPLFLRYGVPVVIATDHEGVARSYRGIEYQRAIEQYALDYSEVKRMVRDSIEHSFLPGESLWDDLGKGTMKHCAPPGKDPKSQECGAFLGSNEKARYAYDLEQRFVEFEKQF